jgi:hypothetical protein
MEMLKGFLLSSPLLCLCLAAFAQDEKIERGRYLTEQEDAEAIVAYLKLLK